MFTMGLPIKYKTLIFIKKEFNNDILKLERRMIRELYSFFTENYEMFKDYKIILYYDNIFTCLWQAYNIDDKKRS